MIISGRLKIVFALLCVTCIAAVVFLVSGKSTEYVVEYSEERTLQFSFTITNTSNQVVRDGVFRAYVPVGETAHQRVESYNATHEYKIVRDPLENSALEFTLPLLAPYQSKVITVRANLRLSPTLVKHKPVDMDRFLVAEKFVEVDHPGIQKLSNTLTAPIRNDDDQAKANLIFTWVANHLESETYQRDERGALWAFENRRGDCTEFMRLFMALARAQGIPVRGVSGYVIKQSQVVHSADFHNWAEIYLNGAWQVVDPQRKVFLDQQHDYIATNILLPSEMSLLGTSHRYNVDAPLSAVMN